MQSHLIMQTNEIPGPSSNAEVLDVAMPAAVSIGSQSPPVHPIAQNHPRDPMNVLPAPSHNVSHNVSTFNYPLPISISAASQSSQAIAIMRSHRENQSNLTPGPFNAVIYRAGTSHQTNDEAASSFMQTTPDTDQFHGAIIQSDNRHEYENSPSNASYSASNASSLHIVLQQPNVGDPGYQLPAFHTSAGFSPSYDSRYRWTPGESPIYAPSIDPNYGAYIAPGTLTHHHSILSETQLVSA